METENQILPEEAKLASIDKDFDKTMDDFMVKMDEYMVTLKLKSIDTGSAGGVPESLLARQDLEDGRKREDYVTENRSNKPFDILLEDAIHSAMGKTGTKTYSVWYYDKNGAQKCAVFDNTTEAQAFAADLLSMGFSRKDIKIIAKGVIEQTGKKLEEAVKDAKEVETKTEVKSLVDNIKSIQLKRQNAIVQARQKSEKGKKSFKEMWKK
jgi:hypothetical protein